MKKLIDKILNLKSDIKIVGSFLKDLKSQYFKFRDRFPVLYKFFVSTTLIFKWLLIIGLVAFIAISILVLYKIYIKDFFHKVLYEELENKMENCVDNTSFSLLLNPFTEKVVCGYSLKKASAEIKYRDYLLENINNCEKRAEKISNEDKENLTFKQNLSDDLINKVNLFLSKLTELIKKDKKDIWGFGKAKLKSWETEDWRKQLEFLLSNKEKLVEFCTIEELEELIKRYEEVPKYGDRFYFY